MMMKALVLILGAMTLSADATPLLRRRTRVAFAEFGRGINPQAEVEKIVDEEVKYRLLMSVDDANSMPNLPADMSIPQQPADNDQSMPINADFSMPMDADFSMPMDADFSMPLDDAMMSLDNALSMTTVETTEEDACDDSSNPTTQVSTSFEADGPVGILADVLSAAIQEDFTLCPASSRMLWEAERTLEEEQSVVLGVTVTGVTADDSADCSAGAADECEVATADFDVIHKEGSSSEEATDEFLAKLLDRLAQVDGVRERGDTSSSPDSSSTETNPAGLDASDGGLGGGEKAATIICSLAAVAVVLVLVQRKVSRNKREHDDKSVSDGSMTTAQNTSAYTTASNSILS